MADRDDVVKDFFRAWSATYDAQALQDAVYRPLQAVLHQRLHRARAVLGNVTRVLDLGIGTGESLSWLGDEASQVVGLDYSKDMLAKARAKLVARSALVRASATDLPLRDACVDAAVSCFSIHWWPDIPRALRETARVLRPGGMVLVMIPTSSLLSLRSMLVSRPASGVAVQWLPPAHYARMAREAGLVTRLPREIARGAWLLEATRP